MIYVDELKEYEGKGKWCHMMSSESSTELHDFAYKIGLKAEWFQDHPTHPHYDLTSRKRRLAINAGATAMTSVYMVAKCSKLFKEE